MSPSALFVTTVPVTLEAFLAPFAQHFRALGWQIDALANGATANERIADSFDRRFDVAWSRSPLAPSNLVGTAGQVRRLVAAGGYDIVHVHTPIASFVTRYALRKLPETSRPTVIYTAHGFHFYRGQSPLPHVLFRTLERVAAPWTDYLVAINDEDYRAAQALGGIENERVRLIPGIGVDTDRFGREAVPDTTASAVREELGIPEDAFVLTMVAEFAAVKRHEHVFQALARVRDPSVVLVLAGDGPLEADLRSRSAALGVADRIRWAGYRRDVPALLEASDAVTLVSEREGLARSLLEGMAAGKPIIGTDTRGIADLALPDSGWIAPKRDATALASLIDYAAAHPDEVATRGSAARERAIRDYALPRIISAYEELYAEALSSRL